MITLKVDDTDVKKALKELQARSRNTTSAMAGIASVMLASVEDNFRAEGRPRWAALKASTLAARAKAGKQGKILQRTSHLARSITPFHSRTIAGVGTNIPYAAAMNNGVKAHHKKVKSTSKKSKGKARKQHPGVVARPFMTLSNTAKSDMIQIMLLHISGKK